MVLSTVLTVLHFLWRKIEGYSVPYIVPFQNLFRGIKVQVFSQEAQARFARARLCLPYNKGRKETLRPK
jgi:hypothetical protein